MEAASLAFDRVRRCEQRIWWVIGVLTATGVILTAAIIIKWFVLSPAESLGDAAVGSPEEGVVVSSVKNVGSDTSWYQPVERVEPAPVENSILDTPGAINSESSSEQVVEREVIKVPPETRSPMALQAAPEEAQQTLLGFEYSSHLYTSTPSKRSLSVEGKRMREGEVMGDWMLAEITQEGAVWDNGEIMVDVPVLDLWQ